VIVNDGQSFDLSSIKEEFATESDDRLILDGLAHMAMRLTETFKTVLDD
jgi:hypothetical protein